MTPAGGARQSGSHRAIEHLRQPSVEVPTQARVRQFRPTPRPFTIPDFDVRLRRELSHRRLFIAIGRQLLRVAGLHIADGVVIGVAALAVLKLLELNSDSGLIAIQIGFVLLALGSRGAYQAAHARRDPGRVVAGVALATAALAVMTLLPPRLDLTPKYLALFAVFVALLLIAERSVIELIMRQVYRRGIGLRRALIVGGPSQVRHVAEALKADQQRDHIILGAISPKHRDEPDTLGSLEDLEMILLREEPAELIIATALPPEVLHQASETCARYGVAMLALPTWNSGLRGWVEPVRVGDLPAFWLHPRRLEMPALAVKRTTDLILTSVGLVVALPLMLALAVAIKIDSRGPVFFRQVRVGLGGRRFMLWKFRSMTHEPERTNDQVAHLNAYADGRLFKTRNDPRITRVGRFLRRFSLDELPQLFNVLAGDMSLVGPRPPVPQEVSKYEQRHFVRLTVVPGVTGPWQTSGRNLITDFEEVVRLEQAYIEGWSLGLDLRIMAKTVIVMASGEGAY
jgi:exopolysaccharide biosynthesis polyprenyl glycosylphosphotransferase